MAKRIGKEAQSCETLAVATSELIPHSDLTFRVLDCLTIDQGNLHHSLLNGCLVRKCAFNGVRLSRCDLEQVQFVGCSFNDSDFTNVEMTSTQITDCEFNNCTFDFIHIEECLWERCDIKDCSFKQSVIQTSHFIECRLHNNNLTGASVQLNDFRRSLFRDMTLGNCTFSNQLMVDCSYNNVCINAESIGALFGIKEPDLESISLIYLGQNVVNVSAPTGLINSLEEDYSRRRWFFMLEILRLNFSRTSRVEGLEACFDALLMPMSVGLPMKVGNISFFERIVLELAGDKKLPALIALRLPEKIAAIEKQVPTGAVVRIGDRELKNLSNKLREIALKMLSELCESLDDLAPSTGDRVVKVRLVFDGKPKTNILTFIRKVVKASDLKPCGPTSFISEETGSYLLFLQTTIFTLAALQISLWLLNGCVHQMIELKDRWKLVTQKKSSKIIRDRILLADQGVPKWIATSVQAISAKLLGNASALKNVASDLSLDNLRVVEVIDTEASGKSSRRKSAD